MFSDSIKTNSEVRFQLIDSNGNIKLERTVSNLVVQTGKNFIAQRLVANNSLMSHMALGQNNANSTINMTTLVNEPANSRSILSNASATANVINFTASFGANVATGTLYEAGIFNNANANSGTMLCRTTFPLITKQAEDTLSVSWNIKIN